MQTNRWQNFTGKGRLFYINAIQANRCRNFIDEGHRY